MFTDAALSLGPSEFYIEATVQAETLNTASHPFGAQVKDADDDLRLACGAFNIIDYSTLCVFDFIITNKRVYAFVERLPFARTESDVYAAYSYAIPLIQREKSDSHKLGFHFNTKAKTVSYIVDNVCLYTASNIGHKPEDRRFCVLDLGGTQRSVFPSTVHVGFGTFSILDCNPVANLECSTSRKALVRLNPSSGAFATAYQTPIDGTDQPVSFVDDNSLSANRCFGQGAIVRVSNVIAKPLPLATVLRQ